MIRVLIVDDKDENLYYLEALLAAHGYQLDTARHGAEALEKARQSPPDLVVSDLLMPVMDGYTLLRHWKADPDLRNIKFVVYTATYTEAEDERLAMSLGADAFILKPTEPEQLLARITEVQSRSAPAPSTAPSPAEDEVLKSYSESLVRKLEQKTLQLQDANRALQQDIAAREQAEAQLHLLNAALIQSSDAVMITDAVLDLPGPHIVFANPAFTRLTGYGVDDIIGKNPRFLQGPRTDRTVIKRLRADLERGETFFGETVNYRKDGSEYEQEWQVAPIRDAQGAITHYVSVQRDVTARNHALRALQDSDREQRQLAAELEQERQRLLAAQRVAKIGSWETDLATGRIVWSLETHRIHGTKPGEFEPTYEGFLQLVHPDERAAVNQELADSLQGDRGGRIEHRALLPDGSIKHVEQRWEIEFDGNGTAIRAIGTVQDLTERVQAESILRNTSDRLALATQSARIGIWDWDIVQDTLVWDAQMFQLYGLGEDEFENVYEAWTQRLHPADRARVHAEISDAVAGIAEYRTRFRIVCPDGQVRDMEANGLVQRDADGAALRMIGANRDITEQMQADRRIRYLNRVYAMTSSINALIVRAGSRDEVLQEACRIAVEAGGFRLAMIGVTMPGGLDFIAIAGASEEAVEAVRNLLASRDPSPSPMAARAMQDRSAVVSNASQSDPDIAAPEMHVRYGIHSMAMLPLLMEGKAEGVMALYASESEFFHDEEIALLTELAGDIALAVDHLDKRDRLAFLAYYDELTGLANRRLFLDRVGQFARSAGNEGKQLAVVLFDLERFKNINDSLGRAAGDQLLKHVAAWLTQHLGDANLLARIDADHFAIVLPASQGSGSVAHVVDPMMEAFLGESFDINGEALRVSARAGIAMYPADGEDAEALFNRAEAALKKANAGSARYVFHTQQMTDAVAGKLALENQLRSALENEEFVLHYQPKVNLASGLLTGAEALIRWDKPRAGLVAPGVFIPLLEETGMINDVGRWALRKALSDWLRWHRGGLLAVPVAVNVSPLQLRDPTFLAQLERAIGVADGAAQGLELEITESMIMEDVQQSIVSLKAIRELGISVAIDDFGTGFSSLGYLAKLPIDALKIDRMFIDAMTTSAEGLSLVSAMLNLAESLQLKVVAEGVETAEQARLLRLLKCDEIQGYLVTPPLPCAEFEAKFLQKPWRMP